MLLGIKKFGGQTFSSLSNRNFRFYFIGQSVSMIGTFMQGVAQSWLVLELTHSGTALGIAMALQYLPLLIFGPWGGMLADHFPKYRILLFTKSVYGILALILGGMVVTGNVQLWMIYTLILAMGLITIIDSPAAYSFISEMVPEQELKNAVTLNSSMVNLSRVTGPAMAGIVIAIFGLAPCFIFNGLSYIAVIVVLLMMNHEKLRQATPINKIKGQIWEGFRYVFSQPLLLSVAVMIAIIGTFTYEFPVSLALLAKDTFNGNAGSYAVLTAAFGLGSALGGIIHASRKLPGPRVLVISALAFGILVILTALMPQLWLAVVMMAVVGIFSIWFATSASTTLQLGSTPELRGRVMVIWSMFYMGSTAIGGPIIGWIGENFGARWSLASGGIAALVAAGLGAIIISNKKKVEERFLADKA